jgi:predicted nucleic acid-binding protein
VVAITQKGTVIGALDLLIAATALHHSLTLFTADHDFERIEGLNPIFLQN